MSISDTAIQQALAMLTTVLPDVAANVIAQVQQEIKLAQKQEQKALQAKIDQGNSIDQIQQLQNAWFNACSKRSTTAAAACRPSVGAARSAAPNHLTGRPPRRQRLPPAPSPTVDA